jgi:hypothetical protein
LRQERTDADNEAQQTPFFLQLAAQVKLRNLHEDKIGRWEELRDVGKEGFVFGITVQIGDKSGREMLLRSEEVDEMLKWVNVNTGLLK